MTSYRWTVAVLWLSMVIFTLRHHDIVHPVAYILANTAVMVAVALLYEKLWQGPGDDA